jgi:hypothetical protein
MNTLAKEEDLVNIYYYNEPKLVTDLWSEEDPNDRKRISKIYAAGNYNYALERNANLNQLYTWGMGSSFVLASRNEENQFRPYNVHPRMFDELPV